MGLFRKKTRPAPPPGFDKQQALAAIPVRNRDVTSTLQESGLVLLTYPLQLKPWFRSVAKRFGAWDDRPMTKKLELDEMGTFVWQLLDGERSVREVARAFADHYQVIPQEAEMSVTAFIREMGRRGVIGLR